MIKEGAFITKVKWQLMQDHLELLEPDCSSFLRKRSQTPGRKSMNEEIRNGR